MDEKINVNVLLNILFLVVGVSLILVGYLDFRSYKIHLTTHTETEGRLTSYVEKIDGYVPVYTYTVNGESYEVEAKYTLSEKNPLDNSSNSIATIYYETANPLNAEVKTIGAYYFVLASGVCLIFIAIGYLLKATYPETLKEQANMSKVITGVWLLGVLTFCLGFLTFLCAPFDKFNLIFLDTFKTLWALVFVIIAMLLIVLWAINAKKSKNKCYNLFD